MNINQNELDKNIALSNNSKVAKYSSESLKKGLNLVTKIENINLNNQSKDWLANGLKLFALKKYEEAIDYFDQVIEVEPNNFNAYLLKGMSFYFLSQKQNALSCFEMAIKINPGDASCWWW